MFKMNSTKFETLLDKCKIALTNNDKSLAEEIIKICDSIHDGTLTLNNNEVLPSDDLYEQLKRKFNITISNKFSNDGEIIMGSVLKSKNAFKKIDTTITITPKYDGCSCACVIDTNSIKIIKIITRGMKDITERVSQLIEQSIDINNLITFIKQHKSRVNKVIIRGELVLNDKNIQNSPAAYVAGQLNCLQENSNLNDIIFRPYEIIEPLIKQIEINNYLTSMGYIKNVNISHDEVTEQFIKDLCIAWKNELSEPIDGVVYSSMNWTYPKDESLFNSVKYGKYAYKPEYESVSTVTGHEYKIHRNGVIELIILFENVCINGKNYSKSRLPESRYNELNDKIYIGSIVTVTLINGILLSITSVTNENVDTTKEISFPKICPFCNKPTKTLKQTKCANTECSGIIILRYYQFFKNIKCNISKSALYSLKVLNISKIIDVISKKYDVDEILSNMTLLKILELIIDGGNRKIKSLYGDVTKFNNTIKTLHNENKLNEYCLEIMDILNDKLNDNVTIDVLLYVMGL